MDGPARQSWKTTLLNSSVRTSALWLLIGLCGLRPTMADERSQESVEATAVASDPDAGAPERPTADFLNPREMLAAGGTIGYIIMFLSFLMVAMIIDNLIHIRHSTFMPPGLAEEIHRCLGEKKYAEALKQCDQQGGFLGKVLHAGIEEVSLGYASVEKAMEDAAAAQAARSYRRIEHLSVISTLAPMLGLMGTVWGMILAFMEFETKANPQISELAPGVYKALITTLQGLAVAIPAIAALAWFRSRVEELSAEGSLLAVHVFSDFRRAAAGKRKAKSEPGAAEP
jgi:biopolymer transport protein ExbB